ncbi:MAG: DUF1559 domain-containing protein [Planctomycetes bacterium]|nr:DUF1559 domain-containing protein [Planctomycetota bacterium]
MESNSYRRAGFTQVELLVVCLIIAVILSIAIPAVQSVREASRRMQCQKRLQQIGEAIVSFEAAQQALPATQAPANDHFLLGLTYSNTYFSAHVHLLPYLDLGVLYNELNVNSPIAFSRNPDLLPAATRTPIEVFLCPSDGESRGTNYRACTGPAAYAINGKLDPEGGLGAFPTLERVRTRDIRDGLSCTVFMCEKRKSSGLPHSFQENDFWFSGAYDFFGYQPSTTQVITICNSLSGQPQHYQSNCGRTWAITGYDFTLYNHAVTPNADCFDCSVQSYAGTDGTPSGGGVYKASSYHRGGVNCVFGDAHVQFVSDSIDLNVWRALSTRAGGEVVNVPGG